MASKIKVYGKAQNRTALGIAHAYLVMYPHATLEDLRKAFPNSICPDKGAPENFLPLAEAEALNARNTKVSLYFAKPDEVLTLADGTKVALAQIWSKPSFDRIMEQGALYDIEVAEFEKTVGKEKGGYRLEYLNGYVPPVPEKKKSLAWLWILLAVIVLGLLAFFLLGGKKESEPIIVEKIVEIRDTVYVQQLSLIHI